MSAFDRRIIYNALKDDPGIEAASVEVEGTTKKAILLRPKHEGTATCRPLTHRKSDLWSLCHEDPLHGGPGPAQLPAAAVAGVLSSRAARRPVYVAVPLEEFDRPLGNDGVAGKSSRYKVPSVPQPVPESSPYRRS